MRLVGNKRKKKKEKKGKNEKGNVVYNPEEWWNPEFLGIRSVLERNSFFSSLLLQVLDFVLGLIVISNHFSFWRGLRGWLLIRHRLCFWLSILPTTILLYSTAPIKYSFSFQFYAFRFTPLHDFVSKMFESSLRWMCYFTQIKDLEMKFHFN